MYKMPPSSGSREPCIFLFLRKEKKTDLKQTFKKSIKMTLQVYSFKKKFHENKTNILM